MPLLACFIAFWTPLAPVPTIIKKWYLISWLSCAIFSFPITSPRPRWRRALDLLQMVLGISTRFIDTCSASVASSELSRLTRSVDACTEQYQKALTTAAAAFNASILTLPTPMEEIAIYDLPASAGTGQFLDSQDFSMMEFPVDIIPRGTSFGVRVSGSSMLPTIQDGEVVFLKRQSFLEDGDIGVFILNGDAYCKRYRSVGGVRLESDNHAAYPPLEVGESDDLRILGKVIGHVYP